MNLLNKLLNMLALKKEQSTTSSTMNLGSSHNRKIVLYLWWFDKYENRA